MNDDKRQVWAKVGQMWEIPSDVGELAPARVVLVTLRGTVVFQFADGRYAYGESDDKDDWRFARLLAPAPDREGSDGR